MHWRSDCLAIVSATTIQTVRRPWEEVAAPDADPVAAVGEQGEECSEGAVSV